MLALPETSLLYAYLKKAKLAQHNLSLSCLKFSGWNKHFSPKYFAEVQQFGPLQAYLEFIFYVLSVKLLLF